MVTLDRFQTCKILVILGLLVFILSSCGLRDRNRPIGFMKIGKISNFTQSETYLPEPRLVLRRDEGGFYVMSTMCTYDVSTLKRVMENGQYFFQSEETTSRYDNFGKVLKGPATRNLPYFKLILDYGDNPRVKDTLYVEIGIDKNPSWRLKVPAQKR